MADREEEMPEDPGGIGSVRIDNEVLGSIAAIAAIRVPGLHHITTTLADTIWRFFRRSQDAGIKVIVTEGEVTFELGVVLEYGVVIPEVTFQVQKAIRDEVERMSGLRVAKVDVVVHGVQGGRDGAGTARGGGGTGERANAGKPGRDTDERQGATP